MAGPRRHGPTLPYSLVAGVVPCPPGWLVAGAKLQGVSIAPEPPRVVASFMDVVDERPEFSVVGLYAPVGLLDESAPGGRTCDRDARALLGRRRGAAIRSAPSRPDLNHRDETNSRRTSAKALRQRYQEVAREMAPYRQRAIFEVHPELTFYQLNEDCPLQYRKRSIHGQNERRALLAPKIPGIERFLDTRIPGVRQAHFLDAAACMWTARRILGRAVTRLPVDPEWDSEGLRMEIVR
jgi:predicted RNase H-like nuclease